MYTTSQLAEIAREYFPSNLTWIADQHNSTNESLRRNAACRQAANNREPFRGVLRALEAQYLGHWVGEETELWTNRCFSVRVSAGRHDPTDDEAIYVVGCVSVLAPIYLTYASRGTGGPQNVVYETSAEVWNGIHRTFEEHLGVEYIPPEVGLTIVPDLEVGNQQFGEATLYDLLFTPHRW